jgi:hypothetical protein
MSRPHRPSRRITALATAGIAAVVLSGCGGSKVSDAVPTTVPPVKAQAVVTATVSHGAVTGSTGSTGNTSNSDASSSTTPADTTPAATTPPPPATTTTPPTTGTTTPGATTTPPTGGGGNALGGAAAPNAGATGTT